MEDLRRTDRFREANELRVYVEVSDGRIVDHCQLGGGRIGATTVRLGPAAVTFPAVHLPDIRPDPLLGASPFPRHCVYDREGKLVAKSGLIDFKKWFSDSFGEHTPGAPTHRRS